MAIGFRRALLASVAVSCAIGAGMAQAQEAQTVEEIIVTAQKRAERLQDVPISISAFSSRTVEELGFNNIMDVATQTPNFKIGGLAGSNNSITPWLNIRGIQFTDTSFVNDQSVAMYVDEVYQAATGAGVQQLFDVERVEVLKGPQGSLFGRNSSTGLVQYVTKQPTAEFDAYVSGQIGSYGKKVLEGAVGGPIGGERLRGRLAAQYNYNSGYRHNPQTGIDNFGKTDTKAVRGTLAYDATEDFTITVSAHGAKGDGIFPGRDLRGTRNPGSTANTAANRCANPADVREGRCVTTVPNAANAGPVAIVRNFVNSTDDPRITYSIRNSPMNYKAWGGLIRADWELGDITITSITAGERWKSYFIQDSGMGPNSFNNVTSDFLNNTNSYSSELRASGLTENGSWVVGAYIYGDNRHNRANLNDWWAAMTPGARVSSATQGREGKVDTKSKALFAHMETEIVDSLTLALGGRYTDESRDLKIMRFWATSFPNQGPVTYDGPEKPGDFRNFSGDVTLRWKPSDNTTTFLKYARGFKSGGWNPSAVNVDAAGPAAPEIVDNFEAGLKADWFDGRLRTNVAAFVYKFQGLQSSLSQIINGASVNNFINAGDATIKGTEWEITALPVRNLELRLNVGTLKTRLTKVLPNTLGVNVGNRLPNAADGNASGVAKYTFELGEMGNLSFQGEFNHQGFTFFTIDNDPYRTWPKYTIYNARIRWDSIDDRYSAQLSIENIKNKRYGTGAFQTASFDSMYFENGLPRWVTLKVGAKF